MGDAIASKPQITQGDTSTKNGVGTVPLYG